MPTPKIAGNRIERKLIKDLVAHYVKNKGFIEVMLKQLGEAILALLS
jgi:hypothetical protein